MLYQFNVTHTLLLNLSIAMLEYPKWPNLSHIIKRRFSIAQKQSS